MPIFARINLILAHILHILQVPAMTTISCKQNPDPTSETLVLNDVKGVLSLAMRSAYPNAVDVELPYVEFIESGGFTNMQKLKFAYIAPKCARIGSRTFQNCPVLEEVNIPLGLRSVPSCFANSCDKLSEIYIPNNIEIISACAFMSCLSLSQVTGCNSVMHIAEWAFLNSGLTHFNMHSVQSVGSLAFQHTKLKFVRFGPSTKRVAHSAFAYISELAYVYYPCHVAIDIHENAFLGSVPIVHFENDEKRVDYTTKMLFAPWCINLNRRISFFDGDDCYHVYIQEDTPIPQDLQNFLTSLLHEQHPETAKSFTKGCEIY